MLRLEMQLDQYMSAALTLYEDATFSNAARYGVDRSVNLYRVVEAHNRLKDTALYLSGKNSCGFVLQNGICLTNQRLHARTDEFYGVLFRCEGCTDFSAWRSFLTPYEGSLAPSRRYVEPEAAYEALTYVLPLPRTSTRKETLFYATLRTSEVEQLFINEEIAYTAFTLSTADGTPLLTRGTVAGDSIRVTGSSGLTVTLTLDASASDEASATYGNIALWFTVLYLILGLLLTALGLWTSLRLNRAHNQNREEQLRHGKAMSEVSQELRRRTEQVRYYEFMSLLENDREGIQEGESTLACLLKEGCRVLLLSRAAELMPIARVRETYPLSYVVGTDIVALQTRYEPSPEGVFPKKTVWRVSGWIPASGIAKAYTLLRRSLDTSTGSQSLPEINGALIYHLLQKGSEETLMELLEEYRVAVDNGDEPLKSYVVSSCMIALEELRETLPYNAEPPVSFKELPTLSRRVQFDTLRGVMCEACALARGYYATASAARERQLITWLRENIGDIQLCAASAAAACGISENEAQRIIRRARNCSVFAYIEELRLGEAIRLLRETSLSVSDIGLRVGYANRTTFYRAFRKRYKRSPSDIRNPADHEDSTAVQ